MVESVSSNRIFIKVSGTTGAVTQAFKTELNYFLGTINGEEDQPFFAPKSDPQVPSELGIHAIHGLDNTFSVHHHSVRLADDTHLADVKKDESKKNNDLDLGPKKGLSPSNIRKVYNIPSNLDGAGQTLALAEFDGYRKSNVEHYESSFGIKPFVPLQNVLIDGFHGQPEDQDSRVEVTLDIELMIALVPKAKQILVYEAPNTDQGFLDCFNQIVNDNKAKSISNSWGSSETFLSPGMAASENQIFQQMAAQGQSLFSASGDYGAYDDSEHLSVDDPGSQPYVTSVGGTSLTLNQDGSYEKEITWNNQSGASGGGISSLWNMPTWQQNVAASGSLGSTTMRNVPDASLNADPEVGYSIFEGKGWAVYGGTSCAAPIWAGFAALVNQKRATKKLTYLGFANPTLYRVGKASAGENLFHDIQSGNNLQYPAVKGFDLSTGWGTINADLLEALSSP